MEFVAINEEVLSIEEDTDWKVENTISVSDIVAKLKQLKEKYRLVVSLYLIEGYDHQEIATILNISENTSRTHLLRGRKLLKESLKNNSYATRH